MPKTMSLKQIAANRRNAQKSTGPTTPNGRAISKMNALKHGILSKEVLVRGVNIKESHRELVALHARFWQELNPIGPMEEMLVDQIVTTHWRLRRALTAESGEIALSVDVPQGQRRRPNPRFKALALEVSGDPIWAMEGYAWGISILIGWMRKLRLRVEQEGELTEEAIKDALGSESNSLSQEMERFRLQLFQNSQNFSGADPSLRQQENKIKTLAHIDREMALLEWMKSDCVKREEAEEAARQAAAVLPAPEILDKILRYETKLERQLYRAVTHLERLQRIRRGEAVPLPLTMEVSERA